MKAPIFVRPLRSEERTVLGRGLRSPSAFVVRRCQCLLQSADGFTPRQIERRLGYSDETVRNAIHAFAASGLDCLQPQSSRPKSAQKRLDGEKLAALKELLHRSPRAFNRPTSRWTLEAVAEVC